MDILQGDAKQLGINIRNAAVGLFLKGLHIKLRQSEFIFF